MALEFYCRCLLNNVSISYIQELEYSTMKVAVDALKSLVHSNEERQVCIQSVIYILLEINIQE